MKNRIILRLRQWNRKRIETNRLRHKGEFRENHKLGVMAIMKNESMNIDEWVSHYAWQGAGQIYLIDNGSTDDTLEKGKRWAETGLVKVITLNEPHKQKQHYWTAFKAFNIPKECQWLLIADLDEFWFCKNGLSIRESLNEYDSYDVIYANWSIFGSSGYIQHPKSLRKELVLRQDGLSSNQFTKWICRSKVIKSQTNIDIHKIIGACSSRTISDNHVFQINHYVTQSLEYFKKVKMTRGDAVNSINDNVRTMEYFSEYDEPCTIEDRLLANMLMETSPREDS